MKHALGIVLTGGGARGAYQAGVLKRIGEIKRVQTRGNPFPIIAGASAGAINGAAIAAGAAEFSAATVLIARLWSNLKPTDVFRCDLLSQAQNSLTWILDLSFGALVGGGHARSLLDAAPLREYLQRHIPVQNIPKSIERGNLYALAIAATSYSSGRSYCFIQGKTGHPMWERSRRVTLATPITIDHICASAAIPLVFQPVRLRTPEGASYFGDGCLRLQQPLSPVIRLGARRILAVGVRGEHLENATEKDYTKEPSLGEVLGVLLNVMFVDHLVQDIEHLERLNRLLGGGALRPPLLTGNEKMRPLKSLLIAPSVDLSQLAAQHQADMPYLIQYFVNSLGRESASCSDLMSYLLFTPKYTRALVEIGYEDAARRIDEIEDLLFPVGVDDRPVSRRRAPAFDGKPSVNGKLAANGKTSPAA